MDTKGIPRWALGSALALMLTVTGSLVGVSVYLVLSWADYVASSLAELKGATAHNAEEIGNLRGDVRTLSALLEERTGPNRPRPGG